MAKAGGFDMETFFAALADRTRLRLINLMGGDEVCVCFFVEVFGINQPNVSRHLAYLRRAGIVRGRRDGKWMHYSVAEPSDPSAARVLGEVRSWLAEDGEMRRDRECLARVCCSPRPPVTIQGAPRPASFSS